MLFRVQLQVFEPRNEQVGVHPHGVEALVGAGRGRPQFADLPPVGCFAGGGVEHPGDVAERDVVHVAIQVVADLAAVDVGGAVNGDVARVVEFELGPDQAGLLGEGGGEDEVGIAAAAGFILEFLAHQRLKLALALFAAVDVEQLNQRAGKIESRLIVGL